MTPLSPDALAAFENAWRSRWPNCPPIGHELRVCAAENWVRFHSLPRSKRYAETADERAEILCRHRVLLEALLGSATELRVVTTASAHEPNRGIPPTTRWRSVESDQLYVGEATLDSPTLDVLLARVADDETRGVILTDPRVEWLYHPYDGGADVIAPTRTVRDELRQKHASWLSSHPSGL